MTNVELTNAITEYRAHFDSMYVAGIPRLLNDDGAFLSFVTVVTGTEALAGLFAPDDGPGKRFREFVARFYPTPLAAKADALWTFRNAMVHAFNPGPFSLTHHASRAHLTVSGSNVILNAEDFYAALLHAAHGYFAALVSDEALQRNFVRRVSDRNGGAPVVIGVERP